MRIEERKGMTEAEADEFLKTLLLRFLVFVLVAMIVMMALPFAHGEFVQRDKNIVAGSSVRGDSKIALALRNNSFVYTNLSYVVASPRAQNISVYVDSVLVDREYVNHTAEGHIVIEKGPHTFSVTFEADRETQSFSVLVINKSYEKYVEEETSGYLYTSKDLYSEGVKAFFGSLSAVVVTVAVVAWYRIPKLKKKVREIL